MYRTLMAPVLARVDLESLGHASRTALHLAEMHPAGLALLRGLGGRIFDSRLHTQIAGIELENPLLVGAGWDKAGRTIRALHELGFAGVEAGTVLPRPQMGNPRPRHFMVGPGVELNHIGFSTPPGGLIDVERNLARYRLDDIPIGISVGKNRDTPDSKAPEDYAAVAARLYPLARYFAINVSSPNTPGLRRLQERDSLIEVIRAVHGSMEARGASRPLFIKVSPDLTERDLEDVVDLALGEGVSGIIATNTTTNPAIKASYGVRWATAAGGISGQDPVFRRMATAMVARIYQLAGARLDVIGVGGVYDSASALEKMRAGARAVQIVSALGTEGPALPGRILRGLIDWMEKEGVKRIDEVIGIDAHRMETTQRGGIGWTTNYA